MSKSRKTFISDAYAARQARCASLGVATFIRPMRHIQGHYKAAIKASGTHTPGEAESVTKARYSRWVALARRMKWNITLARDGYGEELQFEARRLHNGGKI